MAADDREELRRWFREEVAPDMESMRDEELEAPHASAETALIDFWFALNFVERDPGELIFADGSGDAGIDIGAVSDTADETRFDVFQCSSPDLGHIATGRLGQLQKGKFQADIRHFYNTVTGRAKKLRDVNETARAFIGQIQRARELAQEEAVARPLSIHIHALTLRLAHPDERMAVQELAKEAADTWSTPTERWSVHPLRDLEELFILYQRRRPLQDAPEQLKLRIKGDMGQDHKQRGPFLAFVLLVDLVRAYQKHGAALLDANLRYALGRTEVNKVLEEELHRPSQLKWFHEKNNGVVIACDSCTLKRGALELHKPQLVNGGQTVHSASVVLDEIETSPIERRSKTDEEILRLIRDEVVVPARIVVVSGGAAAKSEDIALASNTQNKLSDRTMKSTHLRMRELRMSFAKLEPPWFVETKDGEWDATSGNKSLMQGRTANRAPRDFYVEGKKNRVRRMSNQDLGVALLAFYGFVDDAKPSRVFQKKHFEDLFGGRVRPESWQILCRERLEWSGDKFRQCFEPRQFGSSQGLLAYLMWTFWRAATFPESQQLVLAYEHHSQKHPEFREKWFKSNGWVVDDEARGEVLKEDDSGYWPEQIAKSAYLGLIHQSARVLTSCFGPLDDDTCATVLKLPQFRTLALGIPATSLPDFRQLDVQRGIDGPLTALARLLHVACRLLWIEYAKEIRTMASRQQVLLSARWSGRLSDKVDHAVRRVDSADFRELYGLSAGEKRITGVRDLFEWPSVGTG